VAYLRVTKASLQPKVGYEPPSPSELRKMLQIDDPEAEGMSLWDVTSRGLLQDLASLPPSHDRENSQSPYKLPLDAPSTACAQSGSTLPVCRSRRQDAWAAVSSEVKNGSDLTLEEEVGLLFDSAFCETGAYYDRRQVSTDNLLGPS
jgi:hypothetical protein